MNLTKTIKIPIYNTKHTPFIYFQENISLGLPGPLWIAFELKIDLAA